MFELETEAEAFSYQGELQQSSTPMVGLSGWPQRQIEQQPPTLSDRSSRLGSEAQHAGRLTEPSSSEKEGVNDSSTSEGSSDCSLSEVASESVVWLAHRLGPVLTAKHLSRNLLRMLTLCYMGPQQLCETKGPPPDADVSLLDHWVVGDHTAAKVLDTLANLAMLYGESFITLQYLPHIADLLRLCKKHLTDTLEAGLIGAVTLAKHVLPFLSDTTLMSQLQVCLLPLMTPLEPPCREVSRTAPVIERLSACQNP